MLTRARVGAEHKDIACLSRQQDAARILALPEPALAAWLRSGEVPLEAAVLHDHLIIEENCRPSDDAVQMDLRRDCSTREARVVLPVLT